MELKKFSPFPSQTQKFPFSKPLKFGESIATPVPRPLITIYKNVSQILVSVHSQIKQLIYLRVKYQTMHEELGNIISSDQAHTSFWCAVRTRAHSELWRCVKIKIKILSGIDRTVQGRIF